MGVVRSALLTLAVITVLTGALVYATAPGPGHPSAASAPTSTSTVPAAGDAVAIEMRDISFSPTMAAATVGAKVTWTNHDSVAHTVTPQDPALWGTQGSPLLQPGESWSWNFAKAGAYAYYCQPHSAKGADGTWKGMTGMVHVGDAADSTTNGSTPIEVRDRVAASPIAPPVAKPGPDGVVRLTLETREVVANLSDGASYTYWTFNGTVPGPMLRVTEGDTVELTVINNASSAHPHSIDLHAVTGPGGGAKVTLTAPGERTVLRFKALNPGVFVYHCAAAPIPSHIANGMYGLIVVEPKGGLPPVDKEYYVVQSEWYTTGALGARGPQALDAEKLLDEEPTYYTFNGQVNALTGGHAMTARVNDSVRIFFGVGSFVPSSVHLIGEVFDRVYLDGNGPATTNRQTVMVPAAGAATLEFKVDYPGTYTLVDHSLTRSLDRGAVAQLVVEGAADPAIYDGIASPGSGH